MFEQKINQNIYCDVFYSEGMAHGPCIYSKLNWKFINKDILIKYLWFKVLFILKLRALKELFKSFIHPVKNMTGIFLEIPSMSFLVTNWEQFGQNPR